MLCSVIYSYAIYLPVVKSDITVVDWYDNGVILKPQLHFMIYLSKVFWILDIKMAAEKISEVIEAYKFIYI
jgi:hypothetical protein